ncbi:unnamed protein product [Mytilus coruscus]|uniref:Uncharacterized protein n=1 Tax=Mytilus coruscus TaxID=42192 RepID=A0A6J8E9C0_MYTCO|nr:unnamed protein product [Mytilus coruscus]
MEPSQTLFLPQLQPILPAPLMQTNRTEVYQNQSTISISNLSPIVPQPSFNYQNQSTISISNLSPIGPQPSFNYQNQSTISNLSSILPQPSFSYQNQSAVAFGNFLDTSFKPAGSMSCQNQSTMSITKIPAILPVAANQSVIPKTYQNLTAMPTPNQRPSTNVLPNQSALVKETSFNNSSEFEHVTSTQPVITTPNNKVMTSPVSNNPIVAAFQLPYYTGASDFCDKNTPQLSPTPVKSVRNLISDIEKKIKSSGKSCSSCKGTHVPAKISPRQQTIINSSDTASDASSSLLPITTADVDQQPTNNRCTSQLPASISSVSQQPTFTTVLEVLPTISTPNYPQVSIVESQLPTIKCTYTEHPSVTSSSQPLNNHSNQLDTTSKVLDQLLTICLSSPSISDLSVQSSLLNEDEATELQSILRDSFICMTTLPSSDNEKTEEQINNELINSLNQTYNRHQNVTMLHDDLLDIDVDSTFDDLFCYVHQGSPSVCSAVSPQPLSGHSATNRWSSKENLHQITTATNQSSCKQPNQTTTKLLVNRQQDNPSSSASSPLLVSTSKSDHSDQPVQPICSTQYSTNVETGGVSAPHHQPTPCTSPVGVTTRQSARKRLFESTPMKMVCDVNFENYMSCEDTPSRKRRKVYASCDGPVSVNQVSSSTNLTTQQKTIQTSLCSPSTIAGYICKKYKGKKVTNSYPAQNSRSNIQNLMKIPPYLLNSRFPVSKFAALMEDYSDIQYESRQLFDYTTKQISSFAFIGINEKKPHLFARDLMWQLFSIPELHQCVTKPNITTLDCLDPDIMAAVKTVTCQKFDLKEFENAWILCIKKHIRDFFRCKLQHPVYLDILENRLY